MNDAPAPLPAETVDQLLSAELDGDFDAAATDLGLEPDVARARLAATPGVEHRRTSMTAARDELSGVDTVDELLQSRLVAKALRAYDDQLAIRRVDRSRRSHQLISAAAIAAAVLVVVGVIAALRGTNTTSSKASSASSGLPAAGAPQSTNHSAGTALGNDSTRLGASVGATADYGDVSNANVLRQRVLATLQAGDYATQNGGNQQHLRPKTSAGSAAAAGAAACAPQLAPIAGRGAALQFTASGTIGGKPVGIFVFLQAGGSHVVFVTTTDCRIVNEQVLPPR